VTTRHEIAAEATPRPRRPVDPDAAKRPPRDRSKSGPARPAPPNLFFDYEFKDPSLLTLALTHSSLAYESSSDGPLIAGSDNEQLEFIGDAVLGLVVAEALYRRFPTLREGDLTRLRASLVSSRNLAEVAQRIQLGPMLRLGRGEEYSGGQNKPALLANALEAVIAAMYLDGGLAPARDFVHRHIVGPAEAGIAGILHSTEPLSGAVGDYKSSLQERLQASGAGQPRYVMTDQTGPDHHKRFRIEVRVSDGAGGYLALAAAEGSTKKSAQQEAARLAFASLLSGALLDALPIRDAANKNQENGSGPSAPAPAEVAEPAR
jgi:ribonuclease III